MAKRVTPAETPADRAVAVIAAAASLATAALATAASEAIKTITTAAELAAKVVTDAAAKAVSEFPRLQEDIRELRVNQANESLSLTKVVATLLDVHTKAEDIRLKSIDATCARIDLHLSEQGNRLTTAEKHITRQNLVIFGLAGPVCLIIIGTIVTLLFQDYAKFVNAILQ